MFKAELKIGKIINTFETALTQLDELQDQEDAKAFDAETEITKQEEIMQIAISTSDRAGTIADNFRKLLAAE